MPSLRSLIFVLLLIPAIFAPFGYDEKQLPVAVTVNSLTRIDVTGFSGSPQSPDAGSPVSFAVTVYSPGNVITDFQASIEIYNSNGNRVDTVDFVNSTIAGGEIQTLTKSWSTAGFPAGDYTAYAKAYYNGTETGNMTFAVRLAAQPSPQPGGGSTGSYSPAPGITLPIYPKPPEIELPLVGPVIKNLKVLSLSPYREMLPGDSAIISPLLENPTDNIVQFDLSLAGPGGWFAAPAQNLILVPGEKRTVPMTIRIPTNMPAGYYAFYVNISSNGSEISYPAIIRVIHSYRIGEPVVKRQLSLDYANNRTLVTLTLTNTGSLPVPYVQIYDRVPDSLLSDSEDIQFTSKPSKTFPDARFGAQIATVRWDLEKLMPYESRTIYYTVPLILNEIGSYSDWNLAQLVTIENAAPSEIIIRDLRSPSMLPGETGEIMLKLFNGGSLSREVELDMLGPNGWSVVPSSLTSTLPSREAQDLAFEVESPKFAEAGTYGFTLRIKSGDSVLDKPIFVYIYKPVVEVFAPPITDQLSAWAGGNLLAVIVGVFAVALVGVGLAVAYRYSRMPRYSSERVNSLKIMENIFNEGERGKGRKRRRL